jgi:hemerythrin
MIFLYWDKYFETGYELIDKQHNEYIGIAEKLQNSVYSQDQALFEKLSEELVEHLDNHFKTENELMVKHNYSGYFSHKAEHDRFLDKVKKNLTGLNKKHTNDINDFFEVLYRWFKNHLEINDRKLSQFLRDNNLS